MPQDISHIQRQIQKDDIQINDARKQADIQRNMASQKQQEGDQAGSDYYQREAMRYDNKVSEMEDEIAQLEEEKQQVETRIAELEAQKTQATNEFNEKIRLIDSELTDLKGTSLAF